MRISEKDSVGTTCYSEMMRRHDLCFLFVSVLHMCDILSCTLHGHPPFCSLRWEGLEG